VECHDEKHCNATEAIERPDPSSTVRWEVRQAIKVVHEQLVSSRESRLPPIDDAAG
jgi:hypothetical protein